MVMIYHRAESFLVELPCHVCEQALRLVDTWLAFSPEGDRVPGVWVHQACVAGKFQQVFGTHRVTLMRGAPALTALAQSLQGPVALE
jgi:hypothetical protein